MNETAGKTASCLSITEKRPHKPGGCVGIFFQLFDWNRRFAKKKLFSRKLLPPARAKQVSKKFGGDEKMPKTKLHLIADENSGGFPNMKKNNVNLEAKHEMRSPSLVARLMGLETMPTVGKEKPRKPSFSGSNDKTRTNEFVNGYVESDGDLSLNKGRGKIIEPRPQKIQKTTQFEKRTITRFGSEALHIKSVLSRSRKQHNHPKLLSPVKSPRSSTRSSRLIDAATRILEPRLQATSRAKCALTYSRQSHYVAHDEIMSPDMKKQPDYNLRVDEPLMGQNSCRSCGNLLDDVEHGQIFEDRPLVYSSPVEKVGEVESWQVEQNVPVPAQENNNRNIGSGSSGVFSSGSMMPSSQAQSRWHLPSNDEQSSFAYKQRTRTQTRMSLDKDRIPPRSKLTSLQSRRVSSAANGVSGAHKDFIALNRSLCGRPRPRSPAKVDNSASDVERHLQDEPSSHLSNPVRKRRTASVDSQVDSARFMGPTHGRQRNIRSEEARGRGMGRGYIKGKSTSNEGVGGRVIRNKESDVISFMFNSPMRHKSGIPSGVKVKKEEQMRKACEENVRVSKELPWRGDALGALLEEKLKELTSQEEEEFTSLSTPPKRSTAVILQELISALTVDHPVFQNKTKLEDASKVFANKGNHLSPGSVLEASFSNDSCISSSVDDSSGHRLNLDSTEYMRERLQPIEPEEDLSDSATSSSKRKASTNQMVLDLVNQISKLLYSINNNSLHLPGSKLTHAKDVILNAELLFGDMSLHYSNGSRDFLVSPFLLDELEILARAMWPNFNSLLGFEDRKEGDRLRGFLFDCLIECFDSKYGRYTNSGFKAWTRLPLRIKAEMLLREVGIEVIKWTHLVGMTPDELIECDMSYSLGKWTDFEIEAFETGAEIGSEILQILVDEVVADLWDEHRLVSF